MATTEKVGILVLLLLLLLMFAFLANKSETPTSNVSDNFDMWGIPKPPPPGPGAATDAEIIYTQMRVVWEALLFEAAVEIAGEFADNQANNQAKIEQNVEQAVQINIDTEAITNAQLQQQMESAIATAIETAIETSIQLAAAGEITTEQLQQQIQSAIATALDTAMDTVIQLAAAGEITTEQLQQQMQTAIATAVETAMETAIQLAATGEISAEQLQEQIQNAMRTAVETAMETSIQLANAGQISAAQLQEQMQTAIATAVETAMETAIQLAATGEISAEQLQEQIQNAMRTAVETAMETSIQLANAGQISAAQLQEQMQTAIASAVETAIATSIQLAAGVKGITTEQLQEQIQNAIATALETAMETSIQLANAGQISPAQLQEQMQTAIASAVETAMETSIQLAATGKISAEQLQEQIQNAMRTAVETAMETSIQLANAGQITTAQLQAQVQTAMVAAMETAMETSIQIASARGITTEQLQEQIQLAMQAAMETAMDITLQFPSDTNVSSIEVAAELIKAQVRLEEKINARLSLHAKGKFPLKHALLSSTLVTRIVEGPPRYDQQTGLFNLDASAFSLPKFGGNNRSINTTDAAALSYTPRLNIMQVELDPLSYAASFIFQKNQKTRDKVLKGIQKMRATVAKNSRLPGGRAMDTFMQSKVGSPFMKFIDFFDTISDVLSIACTFTDGFFYDPNGTGLSWEPWAPETFLDAQQKMIHAQLNAIENYNNISVGPDDIEYPYNIAQYPLIAGPLESSDQRCQAPDECIPDKYHGDVEYIQRRIQTRIDVIREKILRDTTKTFPYHDLLLNAVPEFEGNEENMASVYDPDDMFPDDKLIYYLGFLEKSSCKDYDDLYRIAFTRVCEEENGQVYEDVYNENMCGTYKRRRFQCGFKTFDDCKINAERYMTSNGQIGSYGEWFNMTTDLLDKRTNNAGTLLIPIGSSLLETPTGQSACIITGQGIRSLCKQATFTDKNYDFAKHTCLFTEELCQSFGTCVNTKRNADGTTQTYCEIPKALQGAQMFFGSQLPREWVRIHGCHISEPGSTMQNLEAFSDFFTVGGQAFFNDIAKNQANWNAGMKNMFTGANAMDTWMNIATIIGPMLAAFIGVPPGPIMIAMIIIVCAQMADGALKANRKIAQLQPKEASEYTVGGWEMTNLYSNVFSLDTLTTTSATTTYAHGIIVPANSTLKMRLLSIKWTNGTTIATVPTLDVIVTAVTQNSLTFNAMPVSYPGFTGFVNNKGYVKVINPSPIYKINDVSGRKKPQPVGYVDGWITKPLRPWNSSNQIVPVTSGVSEIVGVVEKHFFSDCQPNNKAYPDGQSCPDALTSIARTWTEIYALASEANNWNFADIKSQLERDAAAISGRLEALRAQTQANLDAVTAQRRDLESACRGTGLFTENCWNRIGNIVGGSLEAAFSNLDEQIRELRNAIVTLSNTLADGIKQLFRELGNKIKNIIERGMAIQLNNFLDTDFSGRCVDTRITQNFYIGKAVGDFVSGKVLSEFTRDILKSLGCPEEVITEILAVQYWGTAIGTLGMSTAKCIVKGKLSDVSAWDDECYMAVAVDSATGTIRGSKGNAVNMHIDWDDWMDGEAYKRMCSEVPATSGGPMIRAWSASLGNRMWCIPPQPPESWADPTIGILDPLATQYAVNRSWTNFGDGPEYFSIDYPQYPDGVLYQDPQEQRQRDSAKHWWYQLVYSKDEFNRANLWDDDKLMEHFTKDTISQMRIEYCTDDLLGNDNRDIEPIEPAAIDDRCWGFLSIKIAGYSYIPMAILSKVTTPILGGGSGNQGVGAPS